tara:strand:- start:821 stop:952 length:132 start_codon:yes stop_codon:yes gene_type:complete
MGGGTEFAVNEGNALAVGERNSSVFILANLHGCDVVSFGFLYS